MNYRIRVLYIALLLCLSSVGFSQKITPHAGVAISTNTIPPWQPHGEVSSIVRMAAGVGVEFQLGKKLHLFTACDLVSKGYKYHSEEYRYNDNKSVWDMSTKHNYLEFPLMVRKYFFAEKKVKMYISGGGYCGIGIGGTHKSKWALYSPKGTELDGQASEGSVKYGYDPANGDGNRYYDKRTDLGFTIGAGVELFNYVLVNARYDIGKTDIEVDNADREMNRSLLITVGVPIKLGKKNN